LTITIIFPFGEFCMPSLSGNRVFPINPLSPVDSPPMFSNC
jgi:hypothetical protein